MVLSIKGLIDRRQKEYHKGFPHNDSFIHKPEKTHSSKLQTT